MSIDLTQFAFIFFTGCLCMAAFYHFILSVIEKNRLLLSYSAYLTACSIFLAERVWLDYIYTNNVSATNDFVYNLADEPIQMLIYFTYLRFVAKAVDIYSFTSKHFIKFVRLILALILIYSAAHVLAIMMNWIEKRTFYTFLSIRILFTACTFYMLLVVSRYIKGLFFKLIIAGSVVMFIGNMIALYTSVASTTVFGIFGVMWTCIALVLDVACFSAALGYKARQDAHEKQEATRLLLIKEKQLQQQEISKLNAIYSAKEADRNRIARDLHDEIGSTLSSIHIYSSVAKKVINSDIEKSKEILAQINDNTRNVMENMNDIVWAMKTGEQQSIILSTKIKNLGYELLNAKNINCVYKIDESADSAVLDADLRRNLILIVKEAFNNIVKHSDASEVVLDIIQLENVLEIAIADNGNGFDVETLKNGNGIQNIRFRVNQCGGTLNIRSSNLAGTTISCSFPITTFSDTQSVKDV